MFVAKFRDISTDFTCMALFAEFTKFLVYRKQQIPFSYDKLHYAVKKKQNRELDSQVRVKIGPSERLFKSAQTFIDAMEDIFVKTSTEFSNDQILVSEVVLLFGGSLLTPQQIYRLHFPNFQLGHNPKNHSGLPVMSEVLKALVDSDELETALEKPLPPTNIFLLLRIHGEPHATKWLIPRPRFNIPPRGQQVNMHFKFETPDRVACSCGGFKFFSDLSIDNISMTQLDTASSPNSLPDEISMKWYQVPTVLKGFSDIFVKNVSVSREWLIPA